MSRVLEARQLYPGRLVWLENNGFAFKMLHLSKSRILMVTRKAVYFFPFRRLPLTAYNIELTWRCWDNEPDIDIVCETDWGAA